MSEDFLNDLNELSSEEEEIKEASSFLKISELKLKCRGRNLRLKEEDIIVAVDGEPFHGTILEFVNLISGEEKKSLLTIKRKDVFFDLMTSGSLGTSFKFTDTEETIAVEEGFKSHKIYNIEEYQIFEVLRDIHRKVDIIHTTPSSFAWLIPPAWLIQHRLWEALMVTISIYLITFSVAWWLFAISWILMAVYFNKGQATLLRSFSIYRDNHFWIILAARNEEEVQNVCRKLDPRCDFEFSQVGPPLTEEQIANMSKETSSSFA